MNSKRGLAAAVVAASVLVACATTSRDAATSSSNGASSPSTVPVGTSPSERPRPAFADQLAPLIERAMKDNAIPGAVVLVEKGGEGRWVDTFGTSRVGEDQPLHPEDYFRVGSNTKTMTATVVLQLVQEGMVALDDPVVARDGLAAIAEWERANGALTSEEMTAARHRVAAELTPARKRTA
jgi:D-alanyl-D-alanine carboxypeptidase